MKKISSILIALLFAISINAQDTMYVHQKDGVVKKIAIVDVDSVLFQRVLPGNNSSEHNYFLTGNGSNAITYKIDKNDKSYTFINESSGTSGSGVFSLSSNPNLNGIYETTVNGLVYSAIELPGKFFATTAPSGNANNSFSFGITADLNLLSDINTEAIPGRYIWIDFDNLEDFDWGGTDIKSDGTFTWQLGPESDADFDESVHFAGGGSGNWAVSSTNPSRINFSFFGNTFEGAIYPGKALIHPHRTGRGFTAGIKYPETPVSQISAAGKYKWIDRTPEGYRGVGLFDLPASGTTASAYMYYYNNPYVDSGTATITNFKRSSKVNNAFTGQTGTEGDMSYTSFIILPGEALLFFTWDEDGDFIDCGIAFKVVE
jgi:hypothetical protein